MGLGEKKVVCVTGASGYIGSWLVKELLLRSYTVRASVRNLDNTKKVEHLLQFEGAKDRLHLFEADLVNEGSFDSAIDGCEGVFHTASPCLMDTQDPQRELLDPAIRGTLNVLGSCSKTKSVKTVVLTSSMASVICNGKPLNSDVIVDEGWFSDPDYLQNTQYWYGLSKTLAEEEAWKFAKENDINLVVINPAMVLGPLLQPTLNASCGFVLNLINGSKSTYENYSHCMVHIKDVVEAHIKAFELPTANGRYCLAQSVAHYSEIVQMLKDLFPTLQLPHKCVDDKPYMPIYQISKKKVKSLGIDYIPAKTGLKETVESLKEKKFI